MQPTITLQTLSSIGVTIAGDKVDEILEKLNQMLEERIGAEITSLLDDEQVVEMTQIQDQDDSDKLESWLLANVPDLAEVVQDEFDIFLDEIVKNQELLA